MKVVTATTSTALLLIQALGLQLVCLCGACDLSHAWSAGLGLPEEHTGEVHACCQRAMDEANPGAPRMTADGDCCGSTHSVQAPETTAPERHAGLDLQPIAVAVPMPAVVLPNVLPQVVALDGVRARGPPGRSDVPLFVRHLSLLI